MEADLLEWTICKTSGSKSWTFIVMSQLGECQTRLNLSWNPPGATLFVTFRKSCTRRRLDRPG